MKALFADADFVAAWTKRGGRIEARLIGAKIGNRVGFDLRDLHLHTRHDSAGTIADHTGNGAGIDLSETGQGA
jgi:hypothetical protein